MRRFAIAVVGAGSLAAMSASAMADTANFDATATTQAALSVTCGENLRFGIIGVEPNNAEATITVDATSTATATSSDTSAVYPEGTSGAADCTVTNEEGGDATASLSAATGTFSDSTLADVELTGSGTPVLMADINIDKVSGITNETLYIGGVLTIPTGHTDHETYDETITLTVTD